MQAAPIRCKAILFDMDGTLVDSTASVEAIWSAWAARHGIDVSTILAVSHGRRTLDTLREVAGHLDIEAEARDLENQEIDWKDGVKSIAGGPELVGLLPSDQWAVVTSASRPLAQARLQMAGFAVPRVLVTAEDVDQGKPDPQGYVMAASQLGIDPSDCLVFEDTPAGIEAGLRAGAQVIGLATTFSEQQLPDVFCIADYRQLTAIFEDGIILLHV